LTARIFDARELTRAGFVRFPAGGRLRASVPAIAIARFNNERSLEVFSMGFPAFAGAADGRERLAPRKTPDAGFAERSISERR
jgi:hypothetical protein